MRLLYIIFLFLLLCERRRQTHSGAFTYDRGGTETTLQELYSDINLIRGKTIEINGIHDSGKSNYALWLCQALQKDPDCIVFYFDTDNKISQQWAAKHELDMKRFYLSFQIDANILDIAKLVDVVVIDSLASYVGNMYRFMSKVSKLQCTTIIINQMRADMYNPTPGALRKYYGNLMKRYCTVYINSMSGEVTVKNKKELLPYEDENIHMLLGEMIREDNL